VHPEISIKNLIQQRLASKLLRERNQRQLIKDDDLFWNTIRTKLEPLNDSRQFWNFSRCGGDIVEFFCKDCGQRHQFFYRCSLRWCPRCSWKLSEERKKIIGLWSSKLKQPKHLVLTMRNFEVLTKREIRFFKKALLRLRHKKIFKKVRGGCCSIEFTNEDRGWHMHAHLLLDVRYIPMSELARIWAKTLGQKIAIIKIMDCRDRAYIKEVAKYVVEGSELARWPADQINEFVTAIRGINFFTSFGNLRKLGPQIREQLAFQAKEKFKCECGSRRFSFKGTSSPEEVEREEVFREARALKRAPAAGRSSICDDKIGIPLQRDLI
jgi:hypothetical protein